MLSKIKYMFYVVLLAALVTLSLPIPVKALEANTVRVGYYEDGDYMYRNAQGEYEGYNFEFLLGISKLSGLSYEVVDTGSWENALKLLTEGKIDILPSVYQTEERVDKMLFPDQPMCNIYTTLNVRIEDTQYDFEDFHAFQGMRVGIIKNGADGENFKAYCEKHNINVDIIDYEETGELLGALESGALDGVAITHLGKNSSFRSVAQFAPSPLYMAVSNQRPDLLAQLNQANNDMLLRNPGYQMDLYDKYLAPSVDQRPVFTKKELEYIKSSDPVRVTYDPALAPLSYSNDAGEFSGAMANVFDLIAKDSGLTFKFEANSPTASLEKISKGDVDVTCAVDSDYLWDERYNMSTTLYYLRAPTMQIIKDTKEPIKTLALTQGYRLSEWVAKNQPKCEIIYFSSADQCLDAVLEGKAQATYANTYVASSLLTNTKYQNLRANTLTQYTNDICIGVSKNSDPLLFSILDKYIQSTATEKMDQMLLKHSTSTQKVSVQDFVLQHSWLVLAILSGIILLLCIFLRNVIHSKRRIKDLLYKDTLTGLDNLDRFYLTADETLSSNKAEQYALIYCDIDQFKLINDNFGFEEGDLVLKCVSKTFQEIIEKRECCARISADNFVLLMKCKQWEHLITRLESIRKNLDDWRKKDGVIPYEISISMGIYQVMKTDDNDIPRMIDLANYARHSAKTGVGSAVVCYDEKMRKNALLDRELEGRLSIALEHQEFEAYYQPKVDMSTGELVGSEALVRWNHPSRGLLMPGSFIPLFEQKGLVVQIDFYLYEMVCRAIRNWLDQGMAMCPVSCNFSRLHFDHLEFVDRVTEIADKWQVPHHLLEIEITESTTSSHAENLGLILAKLKKSGFLLSIDDFGSGYSSLGQLQQLRADVLKLDRSLVMRGLLGNREQIVIENLVKMGNQLEMTIICEGVENADQAAVLQKLGCHFAQGFYYYRPMPIANFEALMHRKNI